MSSKESIDTSTAAPTYLGGGGPSGRFADYYPAWIDELADDATVEGSLLNGAAQGTDAVRTIVGTIRTLSEHQEVNFAGPYGDNGWIEDYTARVGGEPMSCWSFTTPETRTPSTSSPATRAEPGRPV